MNIYAEIASKYLDVARCHDALASNVASGSWEHHVHQGKAAGARQWADHYSRLALDVNDEEARQEDERHVDYP